MFQLDYNDHRPLYEQIKEKTKFFIITGVLKPHDQLQSVRELAVSLTINPNTIQKAYKDLETEGYIYSIKAKGNFVSPPVKNRVNDARLEDLTDKLRSIASEMMYMGVPEKNVISIIENIYSKREELKNDD